jgi:hypothetical protein
MSAIVLVPKILLGAALYVVVCLLIVRAIWGDCTRSDRLDALSGERARRLLDRRAR